MNNKPAKQPPQRYVHGFSDAEQDRLYEQGRILERMVHHQVDFSACRRILELGCGVGAQTKILLKRFPQLQVEAVDAEPLQLERARRYLSDELRNGRVQLSRQNARQLNCGDGVFNGIFTSWLLEHVNDPVDILREALRVLAPGGVIFGIEVMNSSFFIYPHSSAIMKYWAEFNRLQQDIGGDPFVGAKLGMYLVESGFIDISVTPFPQHIDQRDPARFAEKIDYWENLILSASGRLIEDGRIERRLLQDMHNEFQRVKLDSRGTFYCTPFKFRACAPKRR